MAIVTSSSATVGKKFRMLIGHPSLTNLLGMLFDIILLKGNNNTFVISWETNKPTKLHEFDIALHLELDIHSQIYF